MGKEGQGTGHTWEASRTQYFGLKLLNVHLLIFVVVLDWFLLCPESVRASFQEIVTADTIAYYLEGKWGLCPQCYHSVSRASQRAAD